MIDSRKHVLVRWEDQPQAAFDDSQRRLLLLCLACAVAIGLGLGIWLRDLNFYLAAAVFLAIGLCVAAQGGSQETQLISLAEDRLQVGKQTYAMTDLAGFWLQEDGRRLLIHVEARRAVFPVTFAYRNRDADEARGYFVEVLPELEPRETTLNDRIAGWLKL